MSNTANTVREQNSCHWSTALVWALHVDQYKLRPATIPGITLITNMRLSIVYYLWIKLKHRKCFHQKIPMENNGTNAVLVVRLKGCRPKVGLGHCVSTRKMLLSQVHSHWSGQSGLG